jgi:tetratricopeptide (TPR) repeat protein
LKETGDDLWRANPLAVLSWLQQDDGDLRQAEITIRESVSLFERFKGPDNVQVGQSLADLGEIVGFQGRHSEAEDIFKRALSIFAKQPSAHPRQTARTLLKRAEVYMRQDRLDEAMKLLREAYLTIAEAQYYDLMWRIQLAMAQINLQRKEYAELARHIRLAWRHRRAIGLTDWALVKQYLTRRKMGAGLPR